MKKPKPFETWLSEFRAKHGNRYDYRDLTRVDNKPYITYVCAAHGEVTQLAGSHAMGKGCKSCGFSSTGEAIRKVVALKNCDAKNVTRCKNVHGDAYQYSGTFIKGKVRFIAYSCSKHGEVTQQLGAHLRGQGCPTCAAESRRYNFEKYREDCRKVHSDRYVYLEILYAKAATIYYLCPEHGKVEQLAADHLRGSGCKRCANISIGKTNTNSLEEWKSKFKAAHGDTYLNYEILRDSRSHVYYECKVHGAVLQDATAHSSGVGCPKCSTGVMGNMHTVEIAEYVRSLGLSAVEEHSFPGSRKRWDMVVQEAKLAIEFDGVYYHSEKFKTNRSAMRDKAKEASSIGYRQLNIWEDEWYEKKVIVKRLIAAACGTSVESSVYARKSSVAFINKEEARKFLEANHIQGFAVGSHYIGLKNGESLVACMVYSYKAAGRSTARVEDCVDIQRYATSCRVPGGFRKLMKHVLLDEKIQTVISYSDPRLFSGGMYAKAGFIASPEGAPDYCYTQGKVRVSKRARQKSWFKDREGVLYDPTLTEYELALLNGYQRLWFRGKVKWTWVRPQAPTYQLPPDTAPRVSS